MHIVEATRPIYEDEGTKKSEWGNLNVKYVYPEKEHGIGLFLSNYPFCGSDD